MENAPNWCGPQQTRTRSLRRALYFLKVYELRSRALTDLSEVTAACPVFGRLNAAMPPVGGSLHRYVPAITSRACRIDSGFRPFWIHACRQRSQINLRRASSPPAASM